MAASRTYGYSLSIIGGAGSGKTEFALSAPGPKTLISVDPNTKAVVEGLGLDAADEDDFKAHYFTMPALSFNERDEVKDEAEESWNGIIDVLRPYAKGREACRAIIFDTATEMYRLKLLAVFGKEDQISPEARRNMMGPVNSAWKGIVASLEQREISVILVHRSKEKWVSVVEDTDRGEKEVRRQLTGVFDMEREGFGGTAFMVSTEILLGFDPAREAKNVSGKFGMKIARSQQRPGIIGQEYWGREKIDDVRVRRSSFPYLSTLLYPKTSLGDWA